MIRYWYKQNKEVYFFFGAREDFGLRFARMSVLLKLRKKSDVN